MTQLWLRVAVALYSLGLLHSILTVVKRKEQLFRVAVYAFSIGIVLHLVSIVEEGIAIGRCPITTFPEATSLAGFLLAAAFLLVYWRYRFQTISVFVFPLVFVLTLISSFGESTSAFNDPLFRKAWLSLHVTLIMLGYTALFLTFAAAVMYLIQENALKTKKALVFNFRLPPLQVIDDLAYKSLAVGFPFITLGIVTGAIWANSVWGSRWALDPKVALSFFSWLIYLALLFSRWTAGWRGRKAAYFAIAGFIVILVTWGTNSGMHSFVSP